MELFDRSQLQLKPLAERKSKSDLSILINPNSTPPQISKEEYSRLEKIAEIVKHSSPVVFAFGAHLVKNGLSRILINLMIQGHVQHLLGNGAVSIHDWELAYQGKTEEDVKQYLSKGQFGLWNETGKYINKAIKQNQELGYGNGLGKFILDGKLKREHVGHQHPGVSILAHAYHWQIPASISPQIGSDIIYTHPECDGAAIGKAAYIDFLKFANTISKLEGGAYISIGSAITSPMVFEKALSMARNVENQKGRTLNDFHIIVNDIQEGTWDWNKGEPEKSNPAYYLRFMKTFSRAGGKSQYIQMDNRAFLHNLYHLLK